MNLNIEVLSKTSLFKRTSDYFLFTFFILIIATFSLLHSYQNFLTFKRFDWHTLDALVVSEHTFIKKAQTLTQYKLKAPDFSFVTTTADRLHSLIGRKVAVTIKTDEILFLDFIKGFYAPSKFQGLYHKRKLRYQLLEGIEKEHENHTLSNLYGALYLAQPVEKALREKLTHLGINHLAAISGFHLGFISFFILMLSNLIYKPLHQRYLPYRNRIKDMMVVTLLILFYYVAFLDFTPSLLRAFGMMLIGFMLYDRGIKLLSFSSLAVTILLLLALFFDLIFSLGFWLSVLGVFMLFLILKHFSAIKKWQLFFLLHWSVFILMMPWVIYFFGEVSLGQLYSPLLSMGFILFYPLSILIVISGYADILDPALTYLLSVDFASIKVLMPTFMIVSYMGVLLTSMFSRSIFIITLGLTHLYLAFVLFF